MAKPSDRAGVLGVIRNPLVFFSLALLLIEGIFGAVVVFSDMSANQQFASLCIMAFLFAGVVAVVTLITVKWPQNLYEDVIDRLETLELLQEWVRSEGFADAVIEVVETRTTAGYGGTVARKVAEHEDDRGT